MVDLRLGQGPRLALQLSGRDEGLAVSIVESSVGEAEAERIVLQRIDDVLRMVSQPTFHEDVGRGLFRALLPGPLGEIYRAALAQATLAGQPLTLELRFDRNLVRAARYPWELLHDGTRFLLQSGAVNLARYVSFPEPPRPLTPRRPMDILVIASNPADQPPLMSEFAGLQSAFETYIQSDQLDLAYLIPPTWESMMDWLLAGAPSVLHFEGHGAFSRTGMLVFETPDGESDPVDAQTLGAAFYGTDLRLAVLSACESATAGEESLLGSVAPTLVQAGIPAVVAMQQRLPDEDAVRFSRGFYTALLAGKDIEAAMVAGRKQLVRTTYWYVPTLYLRTHRTPEIRQAFLQRRVDTAAPRAAPVNLPLRFGVWIRRPDTPQPGEDELRRLLGLEWGDEVSRESSPAALRFPVDMGQIRPGLVDVRVVAPDCDIHTTAVKRVSVMPDFDTPPLWFALTPRRSGRLELIVELSQDDVLVASLAHTIRVTPGVEGSPVASVVSHGEGAEPEQSEPEPAPGQDQPREEPSGPPPAMPAAPEPVEMPVPVAPGGLWPEDDWVETVPEPAPLGPVDMPIPAVPVAPAAPSGPPQTGSPPAPVIPGEPERDEALDQLMREVLKETSSAPKAAGCAGRGVLLLLLVLLVAVVLVAAALLALGLGLI